MVDKQLVHVDKEMASIVADNIGVNRPSGSNVSVSASYPSLSQSNTPRYAYTQKVGVLIGDGFGSEVTETLDILKQNGVFVVIISDRLGTVTGAGEENLKWMTLLLRQVSIWLTLFILLAAAQASRQNSILKLQNMCIQLINTINQSVLLLRGIHIFKHPKIII